MASNRVPPSRPSRSAQERRWEVEDAVRTLSKAEQIKRDPKLMEDCRRHADDVRRALGRAPRGK